MVAGNSNADLRHSASKVATSHKKEASFVCKTREASCINKISNKDFVDKKLQDRDREGG